MKLRGVVVYFSPCDDKQVLKNMWIENIITQLTVYKTRCSMEQIFMASVFCFKVSVFCLEFGERKHVN